MMKTYKILFFNSMIIGTLIAISAQNWLSIWMGLEINLMSFIPLLKTHNNKYPAESAMKYFITQVLGSSLLLFVVTIFMTTKNPLMDDFSLTELLILSTALLLKMGAAPFHFWFPEVLSGLNWNNALILLTWQKIAPILVLSHQIKSHTLFFSIIIITSSMISGIQGLNQICLRKILAYSSINHMSWMISALLNSITIWIYYFLIYSFINMSIVLIMKNFNIFFLNQLSMIFTHSKKIKFIFMMNFLSLGGLPPFLGFLPKWLTINNMIDNKHYFLAILLIMFTLISLFFYLRITFSSFTLYTKKSLMIFFNKITFFQLMTNLFSLLGLIACSFADSFM
uniref:NADH-ubiquinone oxidoreductase chain 2 n=1 Tax=Pachyrhinus yasumatsui TaxID=2071596 RepID=A0A343SB08_9CUCU|nr:NADH dehydrogenase subunit 2 [Pachyrhinus yasumatsui]